MGSRRIYFDHNATTPLRPEARAAMEAAFDVTGNPSSVHAEGREARVVLDEARRAVASFVGTAVEDVVFTSGGTEALNIVLTPDVAKAGGGGFAALLMSAGEHPAVLSGHRFGTAADTVRLDGEGRLDLAALEASIAGRPVMLALQAANNETGVLHPVREAARLVHASGGFVVCDAVQAAGKVAFDMVLCEADAVAISAHKFGGPKGVGALCFSRSSPHLENGVRLGKGVVRGGGQERGLRAGTENIVGIAGMGAACAAASAWRRSQGEVLGIWRDRVEAEVRAVAPDAVVFGGGAARLPNTTSFAVPGLDAQLMLMNLDLDGVAVSAGSACAAGRVAPSHVLRAMGVPPDLATRALRVSLGWTTSEADVALFAQSFARAVETMRPRIAA